MLRCVLSGFQKPSFFSFFNYKRLALALLFILNSKIIPNGKKNFRDEYIRLSSRGVISEIKEGEFFTDIPSMTIFAEKVSKDKMLHGVFIHKKLNNGERVIMAKKRLLEV